MNYNEALNLIKSRNSLGIKPGLSRIKKTLALLGNPQEDIRIIHIAGTNGKGTVAATISAALQKNGLRVGLFTSPWVLDYREQIQLNGEYIDEKYFSGFIEDITQRGLAGDCTEFELVTIMMLCYFRDMKVDYAVIECGMGGRGDATNVEKSNVCSVITSVSLDHTDFLGSTLEDIIYEKEGIIRDGCPCFRYHSTQGPDNDNLSLARRVVSYLGYSDDFPLVKPPARQQRIGGILLDGGHNPEAGRALSAVISGEVAVIGMMKDKDIEGYLSLVAPKCRRIICTDADNPRAADAEFIAGIAGKYCNDVSIIRDNALAVKQEGVSLICGSFYLIREIIEII